MGVDGVGILVERTAAGGSTPTDGCRATWAGVSDRGGAGSTTAPSLLAEQSMVVVSSPRSTHTGNKMLQTKSMAGKNYSWVSYGEQRPSKLIYS